MSEQSRPQAAGKGRESLLGGVVLIVLTGLGLGIAYNLLGQYALHPWNLEWIAVDKTAELLEMEPVAATNTDDADDSYYTDISDPLAVPTGALDGLPEISAAGRPVPIEMGALLQYFEADAALIVDARDPDEYAEGHLPGAINIPYEQAVTDPALLETLDSGGRPIITYCGTGCEVSLELAAELIYAGQQRVAVYTGGFPEWREAGNPVELGGGEE